MRNFVMIGIEVLKLIVRQSHAGTVLKTAKHILKRFHRRRYPHHSSFFHTKRYGNIPTGASNANGV